MNTTAKLLCALTLLTAVLVPARAASPEYINYQGLLNGADGQPLPTGSYTMEFNIHEQANGGSLVWGPFHFDNGVGNGHGPLVPVVNGRFNVIIGPRDTAARSISEAFGDSARFVEMRVNNGSPILPRQQFLSTPYAFAIGNSNYELSQAGLKAKGASPILIGEGNAGVPATLAAQDTNVLRIAGAGADAGSRNIVLDGDVSISGAPGLAAASLSVAGDGSLSNLTVFGMLQAGALSDGTRTRAMSNVLANDPPLIIDATNYANTTDWQIKEVDLETLGNDADGCRIRLYLQHKTTAANPDYQLAPIDMSLYFEQPGVVNNPAFPGTIKLTVLAGTSNGFFTYFPTLDGTAKELLNFYSGPWVSIRTSDGTNPPPTNKFKLYFHFLPQVSGRIMVFDN